MTLAAETIKLSTTRSPWVSAVVVGALSLGLTALLAANGADISTSAGGAVGTVIFLGVPVLMIVAALTITGEYRTGLIRTTFLATPHRTRVLCAKAVVAAGFAGVFTAVLVMVSILLAELLADGQTGDRLSLLDGETWRAVGAIALYAVLGAVLAVGLGALLRHAVAVIAVILLMLYVIEPTLTAIPRVNERVVPLLPFMNAYAFIGGGESPDDTLFWWGPWGSLLYFTGIVAAIFLAGVYVINRRDP